MIEPRLTDGLQHAPRAVVVPEPEFRRLRHVRPLDRASERLGHKRNVLRVHEVERVPLEQLDRRIPEHALHRRARVAEDAVVADNGDDVGRILDQRTEVLFTAAERLFGGSAVDRSREHVRQRLQKVRVVDRELAPASAVSAQDAERPILPVNEHAQAAYDTVRREQRRAAEPRIRRQVFYDDRPRGAQGVAGVGVGVRGDDDPALVAPAHTRAQQQRPVFGPKLEHTTEFHFQHPGRQRHGRVHQLPNRRAGERLLPQVGDGLLLPRGGTQRGFRAGQPRVARIVIPAQQAKPSGVHWGATTLHSSVFFSTVRTTRIRCAPSRHAS